MGMKFYNKHNLFIITERISVFFEGRVGEDFLGRQKGIFQGHGAMFYILFRVITLNRGLKLIKLNI